MKNKNSKLRFPDFIIGGAMKSGTTSLHHILASHPSIYIPSPEIHFFSSDDVVQHPDFFHLSQKLIARFEEDQEAGLKWYSTFFESARENQVVGEDSTVYLHAENAAERIYEFVPDVKLIFMLRNPVERVYSHYWHLVGTGRAVRSFERELMFGRSTLFIRSFYKEHLERYYRLFSREQIKVIIFERFITEMNTVVKEVQDFLGVEHAIDINAVRTHSNAARAPRFHSLQLVINYLRGEPTIRYKAHLSANGSSNGSPKKSLVSSLLSRLERVNLRADSYPPMDADTRSRLRDLFARHNQGLDRLIGVYDLDKYW